MTLFGQIVSLIQAVAWPLVAIAAAIVFRKPLTIFVQDLGRRATKLSLFQFAVELSTVREAPTWTLGMADLRQLSAAAQINDSAAGTLLTEISDPAAADYAVIDLGEGHEWLTSRLYFFAVLLSRMRALRSFVFVSSRGQVRQRFVGVAEPESVRWSLAKNYPWLEMAFAQAYAGIANAPATIAPANVPFIISPHGALEPYKAGPIIHLFLGAIQTNTPTTDSSEWVHFSQNGQDMAERATWLDERRMESDLGSSLMRDSWLVDSPDLAKLQRTKAILRRPGPFIALLSEDRQFKALIDRQAVVERVASAFGDEGADLA